MNKSYFGPHGYQKTLRAFHAAYQELLTISPLSPRDRGSFQPINGVGIHDSEDEGI